MDIKGLCGTCALFLWPPLLISLIAINLHKMAEQDKKISSFSKEKRILFIFQLMDQIIFLY